MTDEDFDHRFGGSRPAAPLARPVSPAYARTSPQIEFPSLNMRRGPAAADAALALGTVFFFQITMAVSGLHESVEQHLPWLGIFALNLVVGIFALGVVAILVYLRGQSWNAVGLGRPRWWRLIAGIAAGVPVSYLAITVAVPTYLWLAGVDMQGLIEERSAFFEMVPEIHPATAIAFALFVGVHEELLFRGLILGRLQSLFRSTPWAVVVCTGIFGLMHAYQGPIGIVQTSAVGLVLAAVTVLTRSLWPAIVTHAAFDLIGFLLIPFLRDLLPQALQQTASAPAG